MTELKIDNTSIADASEEVTREEVDGEFASSLDRRGFLGLAAGAAGLGAAASVGLVAPSTARAFHTTQTSPVWTGMRPRNIANVAKFPKYRGSWSCVGGSFGGFDFVMGYVAEGVQGIDPAWDGVDATARNIDPRRNTSGLMAQITLQPGGANVGAVNADDTGNPLKPVYSLVGGNEILGDDGTPTGQNGRSAEYWSKGILGQSNAAVRDDIWAAINQFRRTWGLDFDDPAVDGLPLPTGDTYQYPGSPDENNMYSLFSARIAASFDAHGNVTGYIVQAPTLLAPDTAYTVMFRSNHLNPGYTGGIEVNGTPTKTTAASPDWPGKVRDGGFWTMIDTGLDVLADIQAARRGERYFTTPSNPARPLSGETPPNLAKRGAHGGDNTTNPQGVGPYWGQYWRRTAYGNPTAPDVDDPHLLEYFPSPDATLNVATFDSHDLYVPGSHGTIPARPAGRSGWPIGWIPPETGFFWGNYDLHFGTKDATVPLHYQSEVPTNFRPEDGTPELFACDLCPNPGSAEINDRYDMDSQQPNGVHTGIGLFDSSGYISGFPDPSNPELDGQMQFGAPKDNFSRGFYGRVHGVSYPRSKRRDGTVCYHFRNYLLWPPRLNATLLGDPTQENFGNINWTVPRRGDFVLNNPYST